MNTPQAKTNFIAELPDGYLTMPPEEVAEILMKNSSEISEIFGSKAGICLGASLANEAMGPTVFEVLCLFIAPLQENFQVKQEHSQLKAELTQAQEDLADCISDGIS